jgi:CNT family concentrative nucleoside transporter
MASDGPRAPASGHDTIEFSGSAPPQYALEKQPSSGSSRPAAATDDKSTSLPVENYGVDSEKQSENVGSLRARSESEGDRRPIVALWYRHWKKVAQLVTFMLFTASVNPSFRCLSGAGCLFWLNT